MKKFVVVIAVVLTLCVVGSVFAACSNVNQINFIHVVARDYEHFTYTVQWVEKDSVTGAETITDIGVMHLTFQRIYNAAGNQETYKLNGTEYQLSSGGVIKTDLAITAGDKYVGDTMQSEVLFEDAFKPIASHKVYHAEGDDARSYDSAISYVAGKNKASITVNNVTSYFKIPSFCYDNDSLYYLVRGSDLGQQSYTLSVAGVDNLNGGTRSVSIAKAIELQTITVPAIEEAVSAYYVALSAASTYGSGTVTTIYFLQSYKHVDNAGNTVDVNKLPVRIDEGNVRYVLAAVSTDRQD